MLVRWIIGSVLILALVLTALDLSANVRHRARARKPPSVVDVVKERAEVVKERAEDEGLPHAAEVGETPSIAPAITY